MHNIYININSRDKQLYYIIKIFNTYLEELKLSGRKVALLLTVL